MKKLTTASLLSAARIIAAPFFAKPTAIQSLNPTSRNVPRAIACRVMAKATTPEEVLAEINRTFAEFREKNDQALGSKVDDVVLNEQMNKINADLSKLTAALDQQSSAIAAARLGSGSGASLTPEAAEHQTVFNTWFRKGDRAIDADIRDLEVKAGLTTQSDPDGGYLVPTEMDQNIDRVLGTVSVMRQVSRVIPISTSTYTKLVNLGGAGVGWVGEEEARPETTTPRLAQIAINTCEIYANPAATQTLLDDARVDIAQWLAEEVSIEFAEAEGEAFVAGNGVKRPRGFTTYDKIANASYAWGKLGYVATGQAAAFPTASTTVSPADPLIDLYYALKAGYRANASWIMSDAVMQSVRKFKDADGAYVWAPPTAAAEVATILGKPVYNDDNMAAVGAGTFPIAFGDFKRGYTIIDRMGTRVLRDPYTNKPFVHFYTTKRVGGGVTNFEAIKLLKVAAS